MCQWREQQTQENVCTARKPLFNHHFFWDFFLQRLDSQYYQETNYNWPPSSLQSLVKIFLKKTLNHETNSVATEENILHITVKKKILAVLTEVSRDEDVIDTTLTSGVIMRVVWGQHSSLWIGEVTSTGSWWDRRKRIRAKFVTSETKNRKHTAKHF